MAKEKTRGKETRGRNGGSNGLSRTFSTAVDLPAPVRGEMIDLLNQQLANTSDLYSQVKQAHWNLKGEHFYPLHLLFDEVAEHVEGHADDIAERAVQLGGYATGTVRMAAASSQLPEIPTDINEGLDYVRALVERMGQHATNLRAAIDESDQAGDKDTADLFTEISRQVDKDLWFLQAHLQG